jgi:hypothetical protein
MKIKGWLVSKSRFGKLSLRVKRSNLTRSVIPSGARNLVEIATGFTLATTLSDCHGRNDLAMTEWGRHFIL